MRDTLCICMVFLLALPLVLLPSAAPAQIIFSDDFDRHSNWSVPYTPTNQACNKELGCSNIPKGYYGYYISRSVIIPTTGNGLHLDGTNKRGSSGKGLTFWDQTDGTMNWSSGMQIGFSFPDQKEVYLRYWVKMQPGYRYYRGPGGAVMRKLNHISHYIYNGKPFTFFGGGGHHPTTVNQLGFSNADNRANLHLSFTIRPDADYNGKQAQKRSNTPLCVASSTGVYNYFDLPDDEMERGNYGGTGTEFDTAGMLADGQWHCLEFYLKNNSAPGVADGVYRLWLDGVPQIDAGGLIYRDAASSLPEKIWNFVHIGGNARNPFRGLGEAGEQWYAIDDLVVSTTYSGPPPAPDHVRVKRTGDSSVKVSWKPGSLNTDYPLDGYRVYYGKDPSDLEDAVTVPAEATEATISGLAPGGRYHFAVTAFNKRNSGANLNESLRAGRKGGIWGGLF